MAISISIESCQNLPLNILLRASQQVIHRSSRSFHYQTLDRNIRYLSSISNINLHFHLRTTWTSPVLLSEPKLARVSGALAREAINISTIVAVVESDPSTIALFKSTPGVGVISHPLKVVEPRGVPLGAHKWTRL